MRCLDGTGTGAHVAAVGVCGQRGAAVRSVHSELFEHFLTCMQPVSRSAATEPPVRGLLCGTCVAAHRARAACCPQTASTIRTS